MLINELHAGCVDWPYDCFISFPFHVLDNVRTVKKGELSLSLLCIMHIL